MKETEEELLKKSKDKVATELGYKDFQDLWRHWGINEKYLNKVARRYCKEYIRNLLPSEQEIAIKIDKIRKDYGIYIWITPTHYGGGIVKYELQIANEFGPFEYNKVNIWLIDKFTSYEECINYAIEHVNKCLELLTKGDR